MSKFESELFAWGKALVIALLLAFIIRTFITSPYLVVGTSMYPNLKDKDRLFVSSLVGYKRFDIIVFDAPDAPQEYVKRVIGLPGDTVEMRNDILFIDGKKYDEPYLTELKKENMTAPILTGSFTLKELTGKTKVPKGDVFVLGDNRLVSKDSRYFGFVPMKSIRGKAIIRFWPLNRVGMIGNGS